MQLFCAARELGPVGQQGSQAMAVDGMQVKTVLQLLACGCMPLEFAVGEAAQRRRWMPCKWVAGSAGQLPSALHQG